MTEKPRRLGRGLEALIGGAAAPNAPSPGTEVTIGPAMPESPLRDLPISSIAANPFQPRRTFKPQELTELQNSMRTSGLLQPISVRPKGKDEYELIAGERRLRAASRLGWTSIPAVVKPLEDRDMLVLALVENLQRDDLNPIDEALGFQRLLEEFAYTQQQVADVVGKDRSTVANMLRVLSLPEGIRRMVRDEQITLGHARALLALPDERAMIETARLIVEQQLSVRDVERMAQAPKATGPGAGGSRAATAPAPRSPEHAELRRVTELLRRKLQTDVRVELQGTDRGTLTMTFYSIDDLHRLVELILGPSFLDG